MNIKIIRIFTKLRQVLADHSAIKLEIAEVKQAVAHLAKNQDGHAKNIELLFQYLDRLQENAEPPAHPQRKAVGYQLKKDK